MNREKKANFLFNIFFYVIVISLAAASLHWVIRVLWPFLFGFFLTSLLRPLVNRISRFSGTRKNFWGLLLLGFLYLLVAALLWTVGSLLYSLGKQFVAIFPEMMRDTIVPFFESLLQSFSFAGQQSLSLLGQIEELFNSASGAAVQFFASVALGAPGVITGLAFAVISSFLITLEYQNILTWLEKNTPKKLNLFLADTKNFLFRSLFRFVKSYVLLFCITFLEAALGLYLLKVPNFWLMALFTALADALPVLGPGVLLVPWSISCFLGGDARLGAGLLAMFGIIATIRTFLEPKILSGQTGLHPLVSLLALYLGGKFFGILGFFLAPIVFLYLGHLRERYFPHWNIQRIFGTEKA